MKRQDRSYRDPHPHTDTDRGGPRQGWDGGQIHMSWLPVSEGPCCWLLWIGKTAHLILREHLQQEESKTDLNLNVSSHMYQRCDLQSQCPYQKTDNNTSLPGKFRRLRKTTSGKSLIGWWFREQVLTIGNFLSGVPPAPVPSQVMKM